MWHDNAHQTNKGDTRDRECPLSFFIFVSHHKGTEKNPYFQIKQRLFLMKAKEKHSDIFGSLTDYHYLCIVIQKQSDYEEDEQSKDAGNG